MLLVDSSVWIDYLGGRESRAARTLDRLLDAGEDVRVTGFVVTEVLQGIRSDVMFRKTARYLEAFEWVQPTAEDYRTAADLYRRARRQGVTIRGTIDCVLAAICLNRAIPLLHADRDFDRLAGLFGLETRPG